jgi:phosphoribosylanthranilate isomerase
MFPLSSALPAVKICGLTQEAQAREVVQLGADALGINFWPKSKRYIPVADAAQWLPSLRNETTLVAVMVNPERELLERLTQEGLVHILQLHGDESPAEVERLLAAGTQVIKALQVRGAESLKVIGDYVCETILLDAYNPGLYGGTGETFPWELATQAQQMFPEKKIILSGGLTPKNVCEAVQQTRSVAVDVASGVESAPGVKDLTMVQEFIEQARAGW